MPAFDPSVIATIGDNGFDPIRAKADAYRLADLIDERQLNKLKIGQAQREDADRAQAKQIFQTSDYSTPEGVTRTAEKLSKAGLVDESMQFIRAMQGLQESKGNLTKQQYEILAAKSDLVGNAASSLANQYDTLIQRGVPPQQAVGLMQPTYQGTLQQLGQTRLPDGTPALAPQDLQ
jgi:hypothetical protein